MSGPACTLLFSNPLYAKQVVDEFIRLVARDEDGDVFSVVDTRPVNGSYAGPARKFAFLWGMRDSAEFAEVRQVTGSFLDQEFGIAAIGDSSEDHRILADIVLWLAEQLAAYIEVSGKLNLPADLQQNAYVTSYKKMFWRTGYTTIINATGFAGWMRLSDFRMLN